MSRPGTLAGLAGVDGRRAMDLWLLALAFGYTVAALVGLPLYGDGAYYWFKLAADERFVVPNLRVGALLPQLPGILAGRFTDDPVLLRHAFSLGYVALPVLSLAACWLMVRRVAPALVLFPLLWLTVHQINFSGVSELLSSAHLAWPFVLAAALWPAARAGRLYGWLLGALFLVLHPMAFVPALGLAVLAAWLGWSAPRAAWGRQQDGTAQRWAWLTLAAWLALTGLLRFGWTLVGANRYERSNLSGDAALHYLFPSTPAQDALLAAAVLAALLGALVLLRGGRGAGPGWLAPVSGVLLALLVGLALWIGGEFLFGQGIKLKAALTFVAGLGFMALAALVGQVLLMRAGATDVPARAPEGTADGAAGVGSVPPVWVPTGWLAAPAAAVLIMLTAKSAGWWLATNELGRMVAEADAPCIARTSEQPPSLQWRWMVMLDAWPVGMNALAFRPRAPAAPEVSLLLPNDGCEILAATGEARLQSWIVRPWSQLEARFGPLRRLPNWQ
ncbi:hypothetical protein [uncultured Thiohalocapsa sp.]|uniref:hypothetical protein n=1 Tax=uncultured Thiohalocapsa sp. TaxID=768990 RepID=UPI0025DE2A7A|nr:hypothetical protein [uncultured Thiohalocapsa sp.]